ncbi:MAG: HD domain-containing phosphohydrolase [Anaerovoracaceae bacterium]|jgi:diguanylate cyclase (GGDEF)-like protein/PAS domain S-box-containing protein
MKIVAATMKRNTALMLVIITSAAIVLGLLYLFLAYNKYQNIAKEEALQLAQSVEVLINTEDVSDLLSHDVGEVREVDSTVGKSLTRFVERTDLVYCAYILKRQEGEIKVAADSAAAYPDASKPTGRICEGAGRLSVLTFDTGQSVISDTADSPCGKCISVHVPIYDKRNKGVIAVLGLNFSVDRWQSVLWKRMVPDIMVVAFLLILILMIFYIHRKHVNLVESERNKEAIFSQLPGMVYRCKNDSHWTMEYVSQGCRELTEYEENDLIMNNAISYNEIISPAYRGAVLSKWENVLLQRGSFKGEYEIITKSGESKWVMEQGHGIYDNDNEVNALEGIVIDITDKKRKEHQIEDLKNRDYITGLYNQKYIGDEMKRMDRSDFLPFTIAICDIDGLRMVNDAYGYEEGDQLIRTTALLIQSCLDESAVLGRTAGGEFTVLLPNTDEKKAHKLKMSIKRAVEAYNKSGRNILYAVSISIGYGTKMKEDWPIKDVLRAAVEYLNRRKLLNQNSSHSAIVSSIMATLYAKSQETEEHGQRLEELCQVMGREMGLSQVDLDDLQLLSKLHDIGKIGIDDRILNKPTKLSNEEWEVMKKHPEIGHKIAMTTPQLRHIAEYILYHHERWDGTGYPKGLKGEEIPIVPRVLAIADAYDAMTVDRIYRKAMTEEAAIGEIEKNAGTQFDPGIAALFARIIKEKKRV